MLDNSNIKIIHWEYDEQLIGQEDQARPTLKVGLTRNINTNNPTGVYFVWTYLLKKGQQVCLHCVCQESYRTVAIPKINLSELKILLYNSLQKKQKKVPQKRE